MATGSVSIRVTSVGLRSALAPIQQRAQRGFDGPLGHALVKIMRGQVRKEFDRQAWFMPSGGVRPWRQTHDFGNRKRSPRMLRASGRYFAALMGGAGRIEQVTARRIVVGAVSEYGPIHRGGSGANIRTSDVVIRPRKRAQSSRRRGRSGYAQRWAMFWRLLGDYGVPLRAETLRRGLRLPRRPHMTRHPELTRKMVAAAKRYLLSGRVA